VLTKLFKPAAAAARERRSPRAEVDPAALELIRRHGPEIMATARRYSQTVEDAEDAYQRGLEILLTKAPSTHPDDLVPWLKTVVKHEAFSLRRQRERNGVPTPSEQLPSDAGAVAAAPHEQVERLDRLQRGAEAMQRLKPAEVRCMLLLAEGHTYAEICAITGFSYTKVNRCLTEGRRSFLRRVEGIESGAECGRLAPLLSALADGEASARDMAALRPHLRTCLSCRAALRDAREVPARVASLAPVGLLAPAAHGALAAGWATLRSTAEWLNERVTALVLRGQEVIEATSSHKLAAAAASAAALGGGGIATVHATGSHGGEGGGDGGHRRRPALVVARPPEVSRWKPAAAVAAATRPSPRVTGGDRPRARHRTKQRKSPATSDSSAPPIEPAASAPAASPPARPPASSSPPPSTGEFGP
jgi:RNA polymerase sigma factor (sigma-70 family)